MVCAAAIRRDQVRATCFSGGGIGLMVPRSGQVPTTTATSASRSRRTASARWLTEAAGRTRWVTSLAPIRITATSGSTGKARSSCPPRSEERAPTFAKARRKTRLSACPATPLARSAPGVSSTRVTPYPAALESPSSAILIAGPGRPRPYQPVASGGGSSPVSPMVRRATCASARRTAYRAPPSTESPPPPYAAADASLRAAPACPTSPYYGPVTARIGRVQYANSVLDLIGNTPLVRLH